jgi:hypothetical protein
LKKRTKKLLCLAPGPGPTQVGTAGHATDKSFLLLFFKKEALPFLTAPPKWAHGG